MLESGNPYEQTICSTSYINYSVSNWNCVNTTEIIINMSWL